MLLALEIFMLSQLFCGGVPGPFHLYTLASKLHWHSIRAPMHPNILKPPRRALVLGTDMRSLRKSTLVKYVEGGDM